MFTASLANSPYSDPWNQSFELRFRMLCARRRRVAYYYECANNSTFRYRAYNMAQALNSDESSDVSASYFFQSDTDHLTEIATEADVLVICRSGYNQVINQWATQFRKRGKKVLFDVDDLVFDTRYTHLLINTLGLDAHHNQVWEDWFAMMARMGQTLRMCDGAITTNDYLAKRIEEFSQRPAAVVPNFMNREQVEISQRIYQMKRANAFQRDECIHLGYFSGSPSHRLDFALLETALESVMAADPRIHLTLVGYIEPGPQLARFNSRVHLAPFQDYVNLQRLVGSVEFNLMPLQSNVFTDCKSELKYFEAAAVGSVSIASPAENYARCIQHTHNGYIARAHEWEKIIRLAVSNIDNYSNLANSACADAMSQYVWTKQQGAILTALGRR